MQLAVLGTGYVGLVVGAGFADVGNEVVCIDTDENKIARLVKGEIPFYEPGLESLVRTNQEQNRLRFTAQGQAAIASAQVVFIAVGTPSAKDGSADLSQLYAAVEAVGRSLVNYTVVVVKSTIPVGTCDEVARRLAKITQAPFSVVFNPEFLKEGDAVGDFMKPDRVIIGTNEETPKKVVQELYAPFLRTSDRMLFMDLRSAEMTKYGANGFLAARVSYMNELSNLCDAVGADIEKVRQGMGMDPRIGAKFLFPGIGFGGSCFPKDLDALVELGEKNRVPLDLIKAVRSVNANQKRVLLRKILTHFDAEPAAPAQLRGRKIALWGLAFKPRTDDIREAPSIVIIQELLEQAATVTVYDPVAGPGMRELFGDRIEYASDPYQATEGADALALITEWHQFRHPNFERLKSSLLQPVIFDGRNLWEPETLRSRGFTYYGIGRP